MRRFLILLVALTASVGVLGTLVVTAFGPQIGVALMERIIDENMQTSQLDELEDGLHVALCGAGGPLGSTNRSGPCVAVVAGKRLFIFDSGNSAARNLQLMRLPAGEIEGLFLTHFHSDHIDGLGELALQHWASVANEVPLQVHGPEGVEKIVAGFNAAYSQDFAYRIAHHGEATIPPSGAGSRAVPFAVPPTGQSVTLLEDDTVKIIAFPVQHDPIDPAVGYGIYYGGRSVFISGDTLKNQTLIDLAKGADLMVHEALSRKLVGIMQAGAKKAGRTNLDKILLDITDYHASPVEAAEAAQEAGVDHLLFYHVVPPLPIGLLEQVYLEGTDEAFDGDITLGEDGTFISLPTQSKEIKVDALM